MIQQHEKKFIAENCKRNFTISSNIASPFAAFIVTAALRYDPTTVSTGKL